MSEFVVQAMTIPSPFHRPLEVVAIVGGMNGRIKFYTYVVRR